MKKVWKFIKSHVIKSGENKGLSIYTICKNSVPVATTPPMTIDDAAREENKLNRIEE